MLEDLNKKLRGIDDFEEQKKIMRDYCKEKELIVDQIRKEFLVLLLKDKKNLNKITGDVHDDSINAYYALSNSTLEEFADSVKKCMLIFQCSIWDLHVKYPFANIKRICDFVVMPYKWDELIELANDQSNS